MDNFITAVVILILAFSHTATGSCNCKQGDSWEYEYTKKTNCLIMSSSEMRIYVYGRTVFILDSILVRSDTTCWNLTVTEDRTTRCEHIPPSYILPDTTENYTSTYGIKFYIINGKMLSNIYSDFFLFCTLPDSELNIDSDSGLGLKVVETSITINDTVFHGFLGTSRQSYEQKLGESKTYISSSDSIFWFDSIGMYKKASYKSREYVNYDPPYIDWTKEWESFILRKRNGILITTIPTYVSRPQGTPRLHYYPSVSKKSSPRFFTLQSRVLNRRASGVIGSSVIIQQFPDGRCEKLPLIH